jgi:hypothetical protein
VLVSVGVLSLPLCPEAMVVMMKMMMMVVMVMVMVMVTVVVIPLGSCPFPSALTP